MLPGLILAGEVAIAVPMVADGIMRLVGLHREAEKLRLYKDTVEAARQSKLKAGVRAIDAENRAGQRAQRMEIVRFSEGQVQDAMASSGDELNAVLTQQSDAARRGTETVPPLEDVEADPTTTATSAMNNAVNGMIGTEDFANQMWQANISNGHPERNTWATFSGLPPIADDEVL